MANSLEFLEKLSDLLDEYDADLWFVEDLNGRFDRSINAPTTTDMASLELNSSLVDADSLRKAISHYQDQHGS